MAEQPARSGTQPPLSRLPSLEQALQWVDAGVDDAGGSGVARVAAIFVDAEGGQPAWVAAKLGRFGKTIAIPVHDCAAVAGRVWVPHEREVIRSAPAVDPGRPLAREHELAICEHFGIPERHGRAAEVTSRPPGAVTAVAAGAG